MKKVVVLDMETARVVGDMVRSLQHFLGITDIGNMVIKGLKRNPSDEDFTINKNISEDVTVVNVLGYIRSLIAMEKIFDKSKIKKLER